MSLMHLYFAYGSNMNSRQMLERCPGARDHGAAILPDHRREFSIPSQRDHGFHVANIRAEFGAQVRGRIWGLNDQDLHQLDIQEGHYTEQVLAHWSHLTGHTPEQIQRVISPEMAYVREIRTAIQEASRVVLPCHVYVGRSSNPDGKPSERYWNIIARGAAECGIVLDSPFAETSS